MDSSASNGSSGSRRGSDAELPLSTLQQIGRYCQMTGDYWKMAFCNPRIRMAEDNQSHIGRMWQVMWIVGLVVAALCLNAHLNSNIHFTPTEYLKDLFNNCEVFQAMTYVSLGLAVTYILWGRSERAHLWAFDQQQFLRLENWDENSGAAEESGVENEWEIRQRIAGPQGGLLADQLGKHKERGPPAPAIGSADYQRYQANGGHPQGQSHPQPGMRQPSYQARSHAPGDSEIPGPQYGSPAYSQQQAGPVPRYAIAVPAPRIHQHTGQGPQQPAATYVPRLPQQDHQAPYVYNPQDFAGSGGDDYGVPADSASTW